MRATTTLQSGDALVVVGVQNDFLPGGALAVPHGDEVVPVLNRYLARFGEHKLPIFATRDWHPANHCSFRTQGGPWPRHCVMYTYGASCPPQLKLAARTKKIVSGNVRKTNQTRTPALALQPNDPPQTKRDARPLKESRQFHAPYIATFSFPPSRSLNS